MTAHIPIIATAEQHGLTGLATSRRLGLRTAIERAAEVERMPHHPAFTRVWWQQSEREKDVANLRKRLADRHIVPVRANSREMGQPWNPAVSVKRMETHLRIERICRWAMARMKREDDAFLLRFTPVRTVG